MYANADNCGHPMPDPEHEHEAWDAWYDDHPESSTPDVEHICLLTPEEGDR
jgi:hypothetical protein